MDRRTPHKPQYYASRVVSDSEESIHSNNTDSSDPGSLTLVAEFDEILRLLKLQRHNQVEDEFLAFVAQIESFARSFQTVTEECMQLQKLLERKSQEYSDLENKLYFARKMLDKEKRHSRKIEVEKNLLEEHISQVRDCIFKDKRNKLDDAREKLAFLNDFQSQCWDPNVISNGEGPQLSAIKEINTTGSLLSDFSYSRSEDDLDVSLFPKPWIKHRPSDGHQPVQPNKKRRSSANRIVEITNSDSVRATTTLTVPKNGPITATSVIESIPSNQADSKMETEEHETASKLIYDMWQNNNNQPKSIQRQHNLQPKTIVMPEVCAPCEKRIRFGKTALKCKDCRATCHLECKTKLPLPCIPYVNTPTQQNLLNTISDYAPTVPPMIPALIVHCLNEIEARGLNEIGIYRIPGSERDVKQLKEKFLKGKGSPCLSQVDINVICGTVKDFLRNLYEPIVTFKARPAFIKCIEYNAEDIQSSLCKIISGLPQSNRDTLAYMIIHLRRVAESKECKMPISNLSMVFGPTIVGFSSADLDPAALIPETRQQQMVMEALMNLPKEFWIGFLNVQDGFGPTNTPKLQQTPSTDSLLRMANKNLFASQSARRAMKRKQKLFPTPPTYKK